jgi:hypothetical protein
MLVMLEMLTDFYTSSLTPVISQGYMSGLEKPEAFSEPPDYDYQQVFPLPGSFRSRFALSPARGSL